MLGDIRGLAFKKSQFGKKLSSALGLNFEIILLIMEVKLG
jgi:hypothetical protein